MTSLDRAFIKAYSETASGAPLVSGSKASPPIADCARGATSKVFCDTTEVLREADPVIIGSWQASSAVPTAPLSDFRPAHAVHESFRALLEVDHLVWPRACDEMIARAEHGWSAFVDCLTRSFAAGHKRIAFTSCRRDEGRTCVALATSKLLSARGLHGVVVDADFDNPMLARTCGISAATGWGEVLDGKLPLGEALIAASGDFLTLMPWRSTARNLDEINGLLRTAGSFSLLADHFDFVVLDAMPLDCRTAIAEFASFAAAIDIDLVFFVRDVRSTTSEQLLETCRILRRAGISPAGLIENFANPLPLGVPDRELEPAGVAGQSCAACH